MPRWTPWRTFSQRTTFLPYPDMNTYPGRFYSMTALAIDSSPLGINHLPSISTAPDSVNDQQYYHRIRNVQSNQGYYTVESSMTSHPVALISNNNPNIPVYYNEEYNGLLPAVEQHRLAADIFDFSYYAGANMYPEDDPDYQNAIDIEWQGEGQYIDGEYSLVPSTEASGGAYTPDDYYPATDDPSVIPQFDWHLYRLPESLYIGKRLNSLSLNVYKTVTFEENITGVLNSLTPINTWPSANMTDLVIPPDEFTGRGTVYHHQRDRYIVPVPELEPTTKTAVFAVVDSPYLSGSIPVPPDWKSYHSVFQAGTSVYPPPFGLPMYYSLSSTFTFTWIPRPYRLKLPGSPPMRQRHRDDGLATDARQQKGQGSSRQSSIRQGGRVYY